TVLLDHVPIDDGKALASPFAHRLGGKERFKNAGPDGLGNSGPGIADPQLDVVPVPARAHSDDAFGAGTFLHDIANCVGGVDDEVQDGLVQFAQKAGNGGQVRVEFELH